VGTEMHLKVKQWFPRCFDIKRRFAICLALSAARWHPWLDDFTALCSQCAAASHGSEVITAAHTGPLER